ncbi:MAG: hypothetical protein ACK4RK_09430 [Gemmataceae bacterium]
MAFQRTLDQEFIDALNQLHDLPASWWRKLVDSTDVFLAIRNNSINAYSYGMSIGKIRWNGSHIALEVHEEYLSLPSRVRYLDVLASGTSQARPVAHDEIGYIKNLDRIKKRAGRFAGEERKGTNKIACDVLTVIDMEAAYEPGRENEPNPESQREVSDDRGRLDLVVLSGNLKLLAFEAKLFSNSELRARGTPKVCDQLQAYHATISDRHDELVQAYTRLVGTFASLRGSFFGKRLRHPSWAAALKGPASLTMDPIPRLLIFDYDGLQESSLKATVTRIQQHVSIPGFDLKHVKTLGKAASVNENHLV